MNQKQIFFILCIMVQYSYFVTSSDARTEGLGSATISRIRRQAVDCKSSYFKGLTSWRRTCLVEPKNRENAHPQKNSPFFHIVNGDTQFDVAREEYRYILNLWLKMMSQGPLLDDSLWSQANDSTKKPENLFFEAQYDTFYPYVQKLIAQPGDQFYVHGDMHGDMHSLMEELFQLYKNGIIDEQFRLKQDNVWLLFLGDYVDRGAYGCEVIYTLLRLSLANPDRVILVRGNHEDFAINKMGGFYREIMAKFNDKLLPNEIYRIYNFLPVAFYLGCPDSSGQINYLQCCHGGMEIGYDPVSFLESVDTTYQQIGLLHQKSSLQQIISDDSVAYQGWKAWTISFFKQSIWKNIQSIVEDNIKLKSPFRLGFLWNDFNIDDEQKENTAQASHEPNRGFAYGKIATEKILKKQSSDRVKVRGVIRAHQHGEPRIMERLIRDKGVYKLWCDSEQWLAPENRCFDDGLVWTFNVSPDSSYGKEFGYTFDAYARIKVEKEYKDWTMQVFNNEIVKGLLFSRAIY